ncbi:MAG: HRDC domain-containing protein [Planctomycetes bacterium]|nr:HRDC domain-containing protein [Planctomycetota bacterium]
MTHRHESVQSHLAKDQSEIEAFCRAARSAGHLAFDTEFVMEDRYEAEVCLVQLASPEGVLLIDPFAKLDLTPVWELISEPAVEKIVHAGQEDLALSVQHNGKTPSNVYDVQIAAGFVGLDYPVSLQRLVQSTLNVRLHKAKTLTDWRRRPLSEAQLHYAVEDVCYLIEIRDRLNCRLQELGRATWAREEFAGFEDITFYRRVEEEKVRHLKGTRGMSGRQLAVVRDILYWREQAAQRLNRPARVVLKDHLLVEIARLGMASAADIRDLRGINLGDQNVHELVGVVKKAMESPKGGWPAPIPNETESQSEAILIALLTAVIRSYCVENHLAYGLVATKSMIRELVRQVGPQVPSAALAIKPELLRGWRGDSIGPLVTDVLSGRRAVHVEWSNHEPIVRPIK